MSGVQKKELEKAKKIVKKYVDHLEGKGFEIQEAFIFGSYGRGNFHEGSDIDVAIISDEFEKDWDNKERFLWHQTIDVDPRLEPVGFTKKNFVDENPLVWEIKKHGIRVK